MKIGELRHAYATSAEFRGLAKSTRRAYTHCLELLSPYLDKDLEEGPRLAIEIRDAVSPDRPGLGRLFLAATSAMYGWAVGRKIIPYNPVVGIAKPKGGSHRQWPDSLISKVLAEAPMHIRVACLLGLQTAQRIGDICDAKATDVIDGVWHVTQSKTGVKLRIPLTEEAKAVIGSPYLLGRHWQPGYLSKLVTAHLHKIGYEGYSFHGLRKAAAARMAEKGCTVEELAAITGHKTLQIVALYVREANQMVMAQNAIRKAYG